MIIKDKKTAVWASPHNPTNEQLQSLEQRYSKVEFLEETNPELFAEICDSPIDGMLLGKLASDLCDATVDKVVVQPAGSPAFQFALGREVEERSGGFYEHPAPRPTIVYAHSKRVSVDEIQEDGSVKKVSIFKHEGWVLPQPSWVYRQNY